MPASRVVAAPPLRTTVVETAPYVPVKRFLDARGYEVRARSVVREHQDRHGDPMPGGSTRLPVMTAYRQHALSCAERLPDGPGAVADLAAAVPDAGRILLRNVYGWFARERRGVYRLTEPDEQAFAAWNVPKHGQEVRAA